MIDIKRVGKCRLAHQMQYSKRAGFSTFELLCVVIIVAIIGSIGVRYLGYITHKQCLLHLKARLAHTQNALSAYYADSFVRGDSINPIYAQNILSTLGDNATPQCAFILQKTQLIAIIGTQNVVFSVTPPTLTLNPKISCNIAESLCRDLSDRILDK